VPAGVGAPDAENYSPKILDGLERENAAISIETLQAKIAASTACHAAIKVNMPLEQSKMEWLLTRWRKPIANELPARPAGGAALFHERIEKAFHRI